MSVIITIKIKDGFHKAASTKKIKIKKSREVLYLNGLKEV